jgi:peptide/nickel transport system permease protein
MNLFLIRRIIQTIPTLFGISLLSFLLMLATPGDPIATITFNPSSTPESTQILRRQLGLDQPPIIQYIYWLIGNDSVMIDVDADGQGDMQGTRQGVLRGDFGQSIMTKRPVGEMIMERIPGTLLLSVPSIVLGYAVGVVIGLVAAINHQSWFDQIARVVSVIGSAIPSFWLAMLLIIVFSVNLGWLPMGGMRDITQKDVDFNVVESLPYMVMPVSVFALGIVSSILRYTRAQILEVLGQDYVRTARAKGLANRRIWWRHVMRNALIPVVTLLGPSIGFLLSGAVIIEQIFSWPGLGRLAVEGVAQRDYPVIMATVVVSGVMYMIGVIISDALYGLVDPRIRLS